MLLDYLKLINGRCERTLIILCKPHELRLLHILISLNTPKYTPLRHSLGVLILFYREKNLSMNKD